MTVGGQAVPPITIYRNNIQEIMKKGFKNSKLNAEIRNVKSFQFKNMFNSSQLSAKTLTFFGRKNTNIKKIRKTIMSSFSQIP